MSRKKEIDTLFRETTTISVEKSGNMIRDLLVKHSLRDFWYTYDNGDIVGVKFTINLDGQLYPFRLPINHKPLWEMAQRGETKYIRNEEQAKKCAWQQVYIAIKAGLSLVLIGSKNIVEVLFSDLLIEGEKTAFELYVDKTPALKAG
jgi:hypothetical protein